MAAGSFHQLDQYYGHRKTERKRKRKKKLHHREEQKLTEEHPERERWSRAPRSSMKGGANAPKQEKKVFSPILRRSDGGTDLDRVRSCGWMGEGGLLLRPSPPNLGSSAEASFPLNQALLVGRQPVALCALRSFVKRQKSPTPIKEEEEGTVVAVGPRAATDSHRGGGGAVGHAMCSFLFPPAGNWYADEKEGEVVLLLYRRRGRIVLLLPLSHSPPRRKAGEKKRRGASESDFSLERKGSVPPPSSPSPADEHAGSGFAAFHTESSIPQIEGRCSLCC